MPFLGGFDCSSIKLNDVSNAITMLPDTTSLKFQVDSSKFHLLHNARSHINKQHEWPK